MESFSKYFSEYLRKARGERSQAEFARFLGIEHQATYQRYESGRIPDGDVLYQIANQLGVSMESLLGGLEHEIVMEGAPKPRATPGDCSRHLDQFLKTCGGDLNKLGWAFTELKENFPLDKWDKKQ